MRFQNFNFIDSFSNASGSRKENMALGELGKLINKQPLAVIEAMRDASVPINNKSNKRGIAKIIYKNRNNEDLIDNLSSLVLLNAKVNGGYSFFGKNKGGGGGTEKNGIFKKIGAFFKERRARKQSGGNSRSGEFGSKIGGFLKDNQDQIQDIGGGLIGGLSGIGASNRLQQQIGSPNNMSYGNTNNDKTPTPIGIKIAIGVGILAVLGIVVYLARRPKNK